MNTKKLYKEVLGAVELYKQDNPKYTEKNLIKCVIANTLATIAEGIQDLSDYDTILYVREEK